MSATTKNKNAETSSVPSVATYIPIAVIGALFITAYWPIATGMFRSWFDERIYMEHGILVLPAAGYMVWTNRAKLKQVPREPSKWGLALLLWGALQATLAVAAHWTSISRAACLVSLVGCIVAIYGVRMARELAYPLCTLVLMIAPPTFVYERLTLDLQLIASRLGESGLEALGYSVMREGSILELVGTKLSVEEACSGLRSLLSILFMCVLYNYFFVHSKLMQTILLVWAVPIAILGNAGRIVATGIASQYKPEMIHGTAHDAFGYFSVVIAAIGCIVLHLTMLSIQKTWRAHHA
jgi:exosortase